MKIEKLLLKVFILTLTCPLWAQESPEAPSEEELANIMIFQTEKNEGEKISFTISTKQPYWIDWGTGEWQYYQKSVWQKKSGNLGPEREVRVCGIIVHNISCTDNSITHIDISQNEELELIHCGQNLLKTIDVSHNAKLKTLHCEDNLLTSIDVSQNPVLSWLKLNNNSIKEIDVTTCPELTELDCINTGVKQLDLTQNPILSALYADNNELTEINISQNPELNILSVSNNLITKLDLSNLPMLQVLYCDNNKLEELHLEDASYLMWLYSNNNQLSDIDLSKNTDLKILSIANNQLESIDLNYNTKLEELYCYGNQLKTIDCSKQSALTKLYCYDNAITGSLMTDMIQSLPTCTETTGHLGIQLVTDPMTDQNVATVDDVALAKEKNWLVKYYDGSEWFDYTGVTSINDPDTHDVPLIYYDQQIRITRLPVGTYRIYSVTGALIETGNCTSEKYEVCLPTGFYILVCSNGKSFRI